jgi:G patch domain-containing protein 1
MAARGTADKGGEGENGDDDAGGRDGGGGGGGGGGSRKRRWGSVATALIEDTPAYILTPKVNNHGIGFDPFEAGAYTCQLFSST